MSGRVDDGGNVLVIELYVMSGMLQEAAGVLRGGGGRQYTYHSRRLGWPRQGRLRDMFE